MGLEPAPELPSLWEDPVQIEPVLVNLVRIALEPLSGSQGPATIRVKSTGPADSGAVEFRITDHGMEVGDSIAGAGALVVRGNVQVHEGG